ncbi:anthrone oxygenase family protein [Nonomuraea sp. NPDC049152]|uniref:anthrone oxygenase family protein n=1 Tax=Nonomuraea sp. NPDC049152 TaxID=3154350 RepID=UPI0033E05893
MTMLTQVAGLLSLVLLGAMAGLFYGFTISVMPGLDAIKADQAVAAMRSVNRKILNPVFLLMYLAAPVAPIATGVLLLTQGVSEAGIAFLAAGGLYVIGSFAVTAAINVPMNNALEAGQGEPQRLWAAYTSRWQRWNTFRGLVSFASLVIAGVGLLLW